MCMTRQSKCQNYILKPNTCVLSTNTKITNIILKTNTNIERIGTEEAEKGERKRGWAAFHRWMPQIKGRVCRPIYPSDLDSVRFRNQLLWIAAGEGGKGDRAYLDPATHRSPPSSFARSDLRIHICICMYVYQYTHTYKTGYLRQPTRVKVAEMPNVATRYDSLIRLSRIEIKVRSHSIVADSKLRSLASSISLMRKTCTIYGGKLRRHINCYERTISSRYLVKVYTV